MSKKFRPLTIIAIMLAGFGALEAGKLALKSSKAFAENKEETPATEEETKDLKSAEDKTHAAPPMCLPVDLAKEAGISAAEFRLLQTLQDRRVTLDERERDIITREGIIKTAEGIVQSKIDNLHQVEGNIQKLLGQVDEMEAQRIAALVRVYEKMKPKDAARVLEGLSDEVVIAIASKMKDQSLALILSKMESGRARQITSRLAQIEEEEISQAMTPKPKEMAANEGKSAPSKLPPMENPPKDGAGPKQPEAPKVPNPQTPKDEKPAAKDAGNKEAAKTADDAKAKTPANKDSKTK